MSAPDDRLEALERRLRRWQVVTVAALLASGVALVSVAHRRPAFDEVRARSFLVVDERGEVVAKLQQTEAGPLLRLEAAQAGATVMVGSMKEDAGVAVSGPDGRSLTLLTSRAGRPALSVSGRTGRSSQVILGLDEADAPVLALIDGRAYAYARAPFLKLANGDGKLLFTAGEEPKGPDGTPGR
jgi:hypothetical protein